MSRVVQSTLILELPYLMCTSAPLNDGNRFGRTKLETARESIWGGRLHIDEGLRLIYSEQLIGVAHEIRSKISGCQSQG